MTDSLPPFVPVNVDIQLEPLTLEKLRAAADKLSARPDRALWTDADIARVQGIPVEEVKIVHYAKEFCWMRCAHNWETCGLFPPKGTRGDPMWCDGFVGDTDMGQKTKENEHG